MRNFRRMVPMAVVILFLAVGDAGAVEPNQQTLLNSVTDFFATVGQSSKEKERIRRDRRSARRAYRMNKAQQKNTATSQKRIKKQQKTIMKKVNAVNEKRYHDKKQREKTRKPQVTNK